MAQSIVQRNPQYYQDFKTVITESKDGPKEQFTDIMQFCENHIPKQIQSQILQETTSNATAEVSAACAWELSTFLFPKNESDDF